MNRREWLRLMGSGALVAATLPLVGCSTSMPPEAIAAWQPPAANLELRRWVLSHAILAPHSHNLQSWLVNLDTPNTILLRMDQSRLLPETDPHGRQMVMSQGTFIEVLAIAAQQRGYRAEVTPFPDGEFDPRRVDERPTASIRLIADASLQPDPLFGQIFQRRTNRSPYEAKLPDSAALAAIADSMHGLPIRCGFITAADAQIEQHRQIANEAWRIELSTPRTLLESYKVLRVGPREIAEHRDGLSLNEPFVRALTAVGLFDRSKASSPDSAEIQGQIDKFAAKIAATPAFFWMISERNDRVTQLQAGRAYLRAQLAATAHGLSMHPLQQALQEYPEVYQPYTQIHQLLGANTPGNTVQMWARLGYAPTIEPAPRRGLAAHLV
jgi:hypothetical protein